MHALTQALGLLAAATSFVILLPQGRRVWRHRHQGALLAGIPLSGQFIGLTSTMLWTAYGVLTDSVWLVAPVVVNAPIAIATIVVLTRTQRAGAVDC